MYINWFIWIIFFMIVYVKWKFGVIDNSPNSLSVMVNFNYHSENRVITWYSHIFPLAVVPGVWPVFGCIFSTRYLRQNLGISWRPCLHFDDVIYSVFLSISAGNHILGPQGSNNFLPIISPIFFSKLQRCFGFRLAIYFP